MSKNTTNQDNIEQRCLDILKEKLNREDCFGLEDKEYIDLKEWIENARLNESSTKFPDIVFKDGFLEHFGITSSYEGKSGAQQMRESSNYKNSKENMLLSSSFNRPFEEHSYINIVNSIQKN